MGPLLHPDRRPTELIRLCVESCDLEAVPVSLTTRIDMFADQPNALMRMRQIAGSVIADQASLSLAAGALYPLRYAAGRGR
jgi:hypothetical protein